MPNFQTTKMYFKFRESNRLKILTEQLKALLNKISYSFNPKVFLGFANGSILDK